jgi:drug/metabolite transporter (DMT)-like permease
MRPAHIAGLVALASIWGSNFLLVEKALQGLNPAQVVMCRLVLGAAGLVLLARARGIGLPSRWGVWGRVAVMGLIGQAVPWLLFAWGQERVDSALAGIYTGATPLLTIPVVWLLLRQRPSRGELYASTLGFAGLFVVLSPWRSGHSASLLGQLLCLAGALCYALAFAYVGHLLASVTANRTALAAAQALAAAALMVPASGSALVRPVHLTAVVGIAALALGAGTAAAFLINYWLVARIGPVQSSLAFYLIPVVAVAIGVSFNSERLTAGQAVGTVLVVAALATLYAWNRRQAGTVAAPARPAATPATRSAAAPAAAPGGEAAADGTHRAAAAQRRRS